MEDELFFLIYDKKIDIFSLFSSIWIKVHFPLSKIFIKIICRSLNDMYNRKQRRIICKKRCIRWKVFCQTINVSQKQ